MTLRDPLGSALGCLLLLGEQSVALFVLCAADIDRKTATPAALDVHRLELAASDAVKDSLARDAEDRCCLLEGHPARWDLGNDLRAQLVVDSDVPRPAGRELGASDEPLAQPAVERHA